jgi:hydroxymethylpyrimidine/phosphomethylpyrimidine kinase
LITFSSPTGPATRSLLTIAGHDPSSGAGISADLLTFAAHRFFGTSAITALTVQSTLGVAEVHAVEPDVLLRTLQNLCTDLPPCGIKIGMLGSAGIAAATAEFLEEFLQKANKRKGTGLPIPVVLDPVLRSSSGADLLPADAIEVLQQRLLPLATWITPNWAELSALTGLPVGNLIQAGSAADALGTQHPHLHIVVTGGDQAQPTDVLRLPTGETHCFLGEHLASTSTHGTGCAFSSALLSLLVLRDTPAEAVRNAKHFVTEAIRRAPGLGQGNGPMNLLWRVG